MSRSMRVILFESFDGAARRLFLTTWVEVSAARLAELLLLDDVISFVLTKLITLLLVFSVVIKFSCSTSACDEFLLVLLLLLLLLILLILLLGLLLLLSLMVTRFGWPFLVMSAWDILARC